MNWVFLMVEFVWMGLTNWLLFVICLEDMSLSNWWLEFVLVDLSLFGLVQFVWLKLVWMSSISFDELHLQPNISLIVQKSSRRNGSLSFNSSPILKYLCLLHSRPFQHCLTPYYGRGELWKGWKPRLLVNSYDVMNRLLILLAV